MYIQSLDVRFDAVRILQGMRARHLPGSRRYEQIEYAIDLALNASRVADEYLIRNVLRDAQRILDRVSKNHPTVSLSDDSAEYEAHEPTQQYEQLVDYESPEELTNAHSLAAAILRDVGASDIAGQVWSGMLHGETIAELAASLGFSTSYISKIRMALAASAKVHLNLGST
jgi:hypothetical protein